MPTNESCLVCREHRGDVEVPGGLIEIGRLVLAFHRPPLGDADAYLGHMLITPTRHVADFADLTTQEAEAMGTAVMYVTRALRAAGAPHIYVATIGHGQNNHLHVHLLPRWPETPDNVQWHSVDDWVEARRAGAQEIARFVMLLRSSLDIADK